MISALAKNVANGMKLLFDRSRVLGLVRRQGVDRLGPVKTLYECVTGTFGPTFNGFERTSTPAIRLLPVGRVLVEQDGPGLGVEAGRVVGGRGPGEQDAVKYWFSIPAYCRGAW